MVKNASFQAEDIVVIFVSCNLYRWSGFFMVMWTFLYKDRRMDDNETWMDSEDGGLNGSIIPGEFTRFASDGVVSTYV